MGSCDDDAFGEYRSVKIASKDPVVLREFINIFHGIIYFGPAICANVFLATCLIWACLMISVYD